MLPNMTNILHVIRLDYMSCILTVLIGKNLWTSLDIAHGILAKLSLR